MLPSWKISEFLFKNLKEMERNDALAVVAGAGAWAAVIPIVKLAGTVTVKGGLGKGLIIAFGFVLSATTTPLLSYVFGWKTREVRTRRIALALGTAQCIDGLVHLFNPTFYSANGDAALASAGNIFLGAGLLGIFSAYA